MSAVILTDGVHLVSDTSMKELHEFAKSIGLKRSWFQNKRLPHYDLTSQSKYKYARAKGAVRTTSKDLVERMCKCEDEQKEQHSAVDADHRA